MHPHFFLFFFFFNDTATTEIYTLSLHDALPISCSTLRALMLTWPCRPWRTEDRKSTRLNSSHPSISYAVFCLKKKTKTREYLERIANPKAGSTHGCPTSIC